MKLCPALLDGARVLCHAAVDERCRPTGSCRHYRGTQPLGPFAGLAVCQYAGERACYLFYCDADWRPLTDTRHERLEDALRQAEFEYEGISGHWTWSPREGEGHDTHGRP